ncbi:MAG: secretin N-terminal domain-containing protein [bacterium]
MKTKTRICVSLLLTFCFVMLPITAFAKKGDKNFKRGMQFEAAQQWEKAAQEFTLAVASDPANVDYQLHFRRASFNASQAYMQQGRALAEQQDFIGAYNAFRQAYGYDPVNELAVSEMERMLRLQSVKDGTNGNANGNGNGNGAHAGEPSDGTLTPVSGQPQDATLPPARTEQLRVIGYSGDLKAFIRSLAEQLQFNVVFDRQSFAQPRTIDINLRDVTTAQALDYIFLQEGLFFQKLSRRTILVADQTRRPQYQQLVLRTFFLSNMKPSDARQLIQQAIPPSVGRPQTIVVPDDATNSLTVRDTAENVRLIGDLLQSIDKDRAEVVMDVNIYEVTKSDFMQFGNQVGQVGSDGTFTIGGSPGFSLLTDNGTINGGRGVNLAGLVGGVPTALAAALVIPPSILRAFQAKGNTRLVASTQVHAFNGEESTARIGQRVPVQTAQTYPFGIQTGTPSPGTTFPTGGFPVINYEPTGLTLKFTPQVFPNLDVQVKMSIESKDVLGASTLTPTFTERTITGTARVQNNRTMMLASVAQNVQATGRKGLPVLSGLPILGRLFSSPTRDDRQVDIVISVTPRVLRAPTVTPRDEEMRPSGTLQSPTTGSLEAMIIESDHEDQIAAARRLPRNAVVRLPDVEPAPFGAAAAGDVSRAGQSAMVKTPESNAASFLRNPPQTSVANQTAVAPPPTTAKANPSQNPAEELPSFVPAPKSLVNGRSAAEVALVNSGAGGTQNALLTSMPKPIDTSAVTVRNGARVAQLSLNPSDEVLKVGDKRQFAVQLNTDVPLGLAVLALRFDPKVVKVTSISSGTLLAGGQTPSLTQSIDPHGVCLISVSALNGSAPIQGSRALVLIQVEAIGAGDAAFGFEKETMRLIAMDAREVTIDLVPWRVLVK